MEKKTHICFIVPNYPTKDDSSYTFVRQLIVTMADLGIQCTVIASTSLSNNVFRKTSRRESHWQDTTKKGNIIDIYQPKIISFSNYKLFGYSISSYIDYLFTHKIFKKLDIKPDILYAHFWDNGLIASIIGKKNNIPVFVATGESKISVQNKFPQRVLKKYLKEINGVIAVSTKNKNESIELNLATKKLIEVIPNAIDNKLFHYMDKYDARRKLGFNEKDYIVAFTGSFINRKGVLRLSEAVKNLKGVKVLYIGSGNLEPNKENALYIGKLPHEKIPLYLNSADVFVLPTLAEGASNAIIEAMACGLPIISSNHSFNDDILIPNNSIRIDPMDVDDIRNAIILLRDNSELREKMSKHSLNHVKRFKIEDRAKKILQFIDNNIP